MKVFLNADEVYPDYSVSETENGFGVEIEITEEEFKRFQAAKTEYDACHIILNKKYDEWFAARKKEPGES